MARKVTPMHARVVAAVAAAVAEMDRGGRVRVAELAASWGGSPKTGYKRAARYRAEGLAGLEDRSRRPQRNPRRISPVIEDAIVELRKRLADAGEDHGP